MSIGISIDDYVAAFGGSGFARQYLFKVYINFPGWVQVASAAAISGLGKSGGLSNLAAAGTEAVKGAIAAGVDALRVGSGTENFPYLVKSSTLPSSEFEEINTHWQGQRYRLAGVQTFSDWSITFNVDRNATILKKFYNWQRIIHDPQSNIYGRPVSYMADQEVHLLGIDGKDVCVYKIYNAWPRSVNMVDLDYGSNEIATVEVTFAYQYHVVSDKAPGALTSLVKKSARSIIGGGL